MFDVQRRIRTSGRRTTESDHWQDSVKKIMGCPRTPEANEEADTRQCETHPSPAGSCHSNCQSPQASNLMLVRSGMECHLVVFRQSLVRLGQSKHRNATLKLLALVNLR